MHANPGNFIAILQFKIQSGDKVFVDHLASCGSSSLYTGKTTQNQLTGICGRMIQSTVFKLLEYLL